MMAAADPVAALALAPSPLRAGDDWLFFAGVVQRIRSGRPGGLRNKLIRDYEVTDAAVHDSRVLDELLDKGNTCKDVFADSARVPKPHLRAREARSPALRGSAGGEPREEPGIRSRLEHGFGAQQTASGRRLVRTIGIVRAQAKIGLQNLAYNIRLLVTLGRMAAA